jgi:DNA-directed RNA polymerase alpha subunit
MDRKRQAQEDNLPNGLSAPAQRALAGAGYTSLEQLSRATEEDIKKLHGIGSNALGKLRRALADKGLSFAASEQTKER